MNLTKLDNKIIKSLLICLSQLILSNEILAAILPKSNIVPGGVAVIPLNIETDEKPIVRDEKGRMVMVYNYNYNWYAILGIGLNQKLGDYSIMVKPKFKDAKKIRFKVKNKKYPTEKLTILDNRKVEPLQIDYDRIKKETSQILNAYSKFSNKKPNNFSLSLPISGRKSSSFGKRRILNGITKNPHSGMDIAAPIGTKIKNPKTGKVILTGDFFYSGKAVFIDHGSGFITSYSHLSKINVEEGQIVKQSDIIGEVGMTGRVTGPHLHWSVSLNNERVDPEIFLS